MFRSSAQYPLLALTVLALCLSLGLSVALLWHLPGEHQSILAFCRLAWQELVRHPAGWRILVTLVVLLAMLSVGVRTAVRQLTATRRLALSLRPLVVPPSGRLVYLTHRLGVSGRLDVLQSDAPFVFCYGLIRPRICLTTALADLLDDDELEAVLLHERYHLRCFDPLIVFVCRTLARSLAFLPVAPQLLDNYLVTKELAADRHTITAQGDATPLASALLKLVSRPKGLDLRGAPVSALNATRERISQLLHNEPAQAPPPTVGATLASLVIVALLLVSSYAPLLVSSDQVVFHDSCDPPPLAAPHH